MPAPVVGAPLAAQAPAEVPIERVRELVQATLDLVRGLGLANTITDDTQRRKRILDQWARTLDARIFPLPDAEEAS